MSTRRPSLSDLTLTKPPKAGADIPSAAPRPRDQVIVKALSVRVRDDAWRQLRDLAHAETTATHRATTQSLMIEAMNLLFRDRGLPEIATPPPEGSAARR